MKFGLCKYFLRLFATQVLLGTSLIMTACSDSQKPNYEYVPHMMDSYAIKAQHVWPDGKGMREAPQNTIPQNFEPYHYINDPEGAGKNLKNPLPKTKEILMRGQKLFNTYCIVCHGPKGEGNGTIVPKFPRPPTLQSDKVRQWTDGRIFHTITVGQNLMPSYASQLDATERWAIIHYLRVLQRAMHPLPGDIK